MVRARKSKEILRTSPSLTRLLRSYIMHCRDCMSSLLEVPTLKDYYFNSFDQDKRRSLIYEEYLRKVSIPKE